ncbi:hypothetical protein GUJ93_ZPchr0002g24790 [Zizania palustris]|uniref:Uncharacterized protein n=1 Tax=Zizania palustris TaxID=103762 RepID=A0A8J5RGI6_ZIZPA|nr:hypothetical protein GUJ93_ZPchr0002g24790 [Zizania palustris]
MALCCRDGPDGGMGPLGRNPKKLLEAELPLSKGLPLNGCMPPLDASQLDATTRSVITTTSHHQLLLLLVCEQPAMEKTTTTTSSSDPPPLHHHHQQQQLEVSSELERKKWRRST